MPSPQWVASRVKGGSAASNAIYDVFFKRSSTYMATVMVTATFAGVGYDYFMNAIWDWNNKGVRPIHLRGRTPQFCVASLGSQLLI